jgi:hypothetical protein
MRSPSVQRVLHAHHVASAFQTLQTLQTLGMVAVWHPRSVNAAYGAPTQPSVRHAFFFPDERQLLDIGDGPEWRGWVGEPKNACDERKDEGGKEKRRRGRERGGG